MIIEKIEKQKKRNWKVALKMHENKFLKSTNLLHKRFHWIYTKLIHWLYSYISWDIGLQMTILLGGLYYHIIETINFSSKVDDTYLSTDKIPLVYIVLFLIMFIVFYGTVVTTNSSTKFSKRIFVGSILTIGLQLGLSYCNHHPWTYLGKNSEINELMTKETFLNGFPSFCGLIWITLTLLAEEDSA
jgi:hypothetical protein